MTQTLSKLNETLATFGKWSDVYFEKLPALPLQHPHYK